MMAQSDELKSSSRPSGGTDTKIRKESDSHHQPDDNLEGLANLVRIHIYLDGFMDGAKEGGLPTAALEKLTEIRETAVQRILSKVSQPGGEAELRNLFSHESLEVGHNERKDLLLSLANMKERSGITWFWRKWSGTLWPEDSDELLAVADELRAIWKCDAEISVDLLRKYLIQKPEDILNRWLRWRPSREQVEVRKSELLKEAQERLPKPFNSLRKPSSTEGFFENVAVAFRCSLWSRSLVPEQRNLRSILIQGVFEHWGHFRCCANTDCVTPYFIAKRKDQTVCDAEICKAEKQRQHALNWWRENRAKKPHMEAVSKTAKKGSKGNVTRKAR